MLILYRLWSAEIWQGWKVHWFLWQDGVPANEPSLHQRHWWGALCRGKTCCWRRSHTSHRNLIALDWMRRINPSLPMIVKLEYSKDLKSGRPLAYLVKEIAENIDAMLHRNNHSQTQMVTSEPSPASIASSVENPSVLRVSSFPYRPRPPTANFRPFTPRQNFPRPPYRPSNPRQSFSEKKTLLSCLLFFGEKT